MNYYQMHRALDASRGKASSHHCRCGEPAQDWAYQHTAGEDELVEDGLPFSLNPDDYEPMCRSCHAELDDTGAKIGPKTRAAQLRRLEEDPAFRDLKTSVARSMTAARVERAEADPEFKEHLRAASVRGATAGAKIRRKCEECNVKSHPVGIGRHQKATGHTGWVVVP